MRKEKPQSRSAFTPDSLAAHKTDRRLAGLKDTIRHEIADLLTRRYYPHFGEEQLKHECKRLYRIATEQLDAEKTRHVLRGGWLQWLERHRDYIDGMALSLNPLPSSQWSTFYDSDEAALLSDWLSVQSDLFVVCSTCAEMRGLLGQEDDDDPSGQEHEPESASGRGSAVADRNHSPST